MKRFAIVIRGPVGAGKSTIGAKLKKKFSNTIHFDIDHFKHIISEDSSPVRTKIAHDTGTYLLNQLIKNKYNVIIEEIFRQDYYNRIISLLKKREYKILTVFLTAPLKTLVSRDKARKHKTKGKKIVERLHKEIKPFKEELIIDTSKSDVNSIVSIISKRIQIQ